MRRLVVIGALLAAACSNKPTSFGVDVEARTGMLPSATRDAIVTARLLVTGAETFSKDIGGVAKAAKSGSFKFRYIPGVHSGTITIRVDGVDGSGNTIAGGTAPPVNVADGKSVDAVLTLAINGNGVACMAATDCISGNCVDGFCCDTACDGVCESCGQSGLEGVCTPAMMGSDPDGDCAAKIVTQNNDGGTGDADGGTGSGGVTGVMSNPQACAGTCNGMGACTYPDTTTSCGSNFCSANATTGSLFCDGAGSCGEKDNMCTDYVCDATNGNCKTSCNADSDCQSGDFCNLNINKCVVQHVNGTACVNPDECASGFCSTGVCCNTDCSATGQSCNNVGTVGKCQCTGTTCDPGVACQIFYKDSDGDGYGDSSGTIANGRAVAGCASGTNSTPPAGFVADKTDCDDADGNAHPGQTAFFSTPSHGTGTYDYNCDGTLEKGLPEYPGGSCGFCSGGIGSCTKGATCGAAGDQSTLACGITKVGMFFCLCCDLNNAGFLETVNCGTGGTWEVCGTCSAAGGAPTNSYSYTNTQTCN